MVTRLPPQGQRVPSLVRELKIDPVCHTAQPVKEKDVFQKKARKEKVWVA